MKREHLLCRYMEKGEMDGDIASVCFVTGKRRQSRPIIDVGCEPQPSQTG